MTGGYVPIVGQGRARWNNVHVADLAQLFVLLTEAALDSTVSKNEKLWNHNGYYLVENGEHSWAELAHLMGQTATKLGLVEKKLEAQKLDKDKSIEQAGFEAVSWGYNSRGKAQRARELVGWTPKESSIEAKVDEILRDEATRLGKK